MPDPGESFPSQETSLDTNGLEHTSTPGLARRRLFPWPSWAYAEDTRSRPFGIVLPTTDNPPGWELVNFDNYNVIPRRAQGEVEVLLPLPKLMFYDSARQHAEFAQPQQFLPHAIVTPQEKQLLDQILAEREPVVPNTPRREAPDEEEDAIHDNALPAPTAEEPEEEIPDQVRKQWLSFLGAFAQSKHSFDQGRTNAAPIAVKLAED